VECLNSGSKHQQGLKEDQGSLMRDRVMPESSEEEDASALAQMHGLEYVAPRLINTRPELADVFPEQFARAHNVVPQPSGGAVLNILMSDPLDFETIDRARFLSGRQIRVALASRGAIREAIERVYRRSD
jgi:type IV pilus assembly protein PilB